MQQIRKSQINMTKTTAGHIEMRRSLVGFGALAHHANLNDCPGNSFENLFERRFLLGSPSNVNQKQLKI